MAQSTARASAERNLWRYKVFAAVAFTPFFLPIIVLFWQDCGLNMFEVFLLQTLFAVAVAVLEVPTGMVADRMGKRKSLLIGLSIVFLSLVAYAMSCSFWAFLVVEIVLALGFTFVSGADSALLYDSLKHLGREAEYKRREGEALAIRMVSCAVATLVGGVIGDWSLDAAMWATIVGPFVSLFVIWGMVEVNPPSPDETLRDSLRSYRKLIGDASRFIRRHQYVRWQILTFAVFSGSATWLLWLYQPYMQMSGLDIWAFGAAFALFNLFAALCSRFAHVFEEKLGPGRANLAMMALQVVPLLLMARFIGPMSFLFILGHQAVRGFIQPITNERILRFTYADKRATVLSLKSLGGRLFFVFTGPIVGWMSDTQSMSTVLDMQAVALGGIFVVLAVLYRMIPRKYFAVKPAVEDHQ
jgi:predicted MFS family arabinose efflux permease